MTIIGLNAAQCGMGRAALGLGIPALAASAGVGIQDILDLESGSTIAPNLSEKVAKALADGGITFYAASDGSERMRVRTLDGIIEAPVTMRSSIKR